MSGEHYVYILYREDGVTPFYVGMGKKDRIEQHERQAARGYKDNKSNIIRAMQSKSMTLVKRKVHEGLTKEQAVAAEIRLIAELGRRPSGPLVNLCAGGEGSADLPPELLAARGAKITAAKTGMKYSEQARANCRAAMQRLWSAPGHQARRDAVRQQRLGSTTPPEVRAKIGAAQRGKKRSPETCAKLGAVNRGRKRSQESVERIRQAQLLLHEQRRQEG